MIYDINPMTYAKVNIRMISFPPIQIVTYANVNLLMVFSPVQSYLLNFPVLNFILLTIACVEMTTAALLMLIYQPMMPIKTKINMIHVMMKATTQNMSLDYYNLSLLS